MTRKFEAYNYFDSRKFLRDLYKWKKAQNSKFTVRYLAEKTGLKSSGYITNILQGKVNLPPKLVLRLAAAFELKRRETEYLSALVSYSSAKTHSEKKYHFEQLMSLKRSRIKNLDLSQYEYFSKWYYVAIRECLDFFLFKDDYAALAKKLKPRITTAQAKKAVALLEKLGLIKKNPDGYYTKAEAVVSVDEWKSLAINDFQLSMIDKARDAIENTPPAERSVSGLTLSISEGSIKKLKEKIKRFREEVLDMVQKDDDIDRVFQVNITAFPLTQTDREYKK